MLRGAPAAQVRPAPPDASGVLPSAGLSGRLDAGVEGSDAAQYKMWGNGMALPCVLYVMQGIAEAGGASDADATD